MPVKSSRTPRDLSGAGRASSSYVEAAKGISFEGGVSQPFNYPESLMVDKKGGAK